MEQPVASRHPIVGSWSVTVTTDGEQTPYLFTITADSCLTLSGPPVFPRESESEDPHTRNGSAFLSAGHGAWESRGEDEVVLTFVRLVADGTGAFLGRRVTRAQVGFDNGTEIWNGQFTTDVLAPTGGEMPYGGVGTLRAERIRAEDLPGEGGVIRPVKP